MQEELRMVHPGLRADLPAQIEGRGFASSVLPQPGGP